LPETLLESELFGHVKGAFTGAIQNRKGRFELADKGTLFLDEVSEMSPRVQVKVLRVLQEGEFEPVGGSRTLRVEVRIVAATNTDLKDAVHEGKFRQDLYYRLHVVPIHLPPLRERREDIPLLVDHFLEKFNRENHKSVTKITREVLDRLLEYPWPGNVRELENCIEHAVVMSPGNTLTVNILPREIQAKASTRSSRRTPSGDTGLEAEIRALIERLYKTAEESAGAREQLRAMIERTIISRAINEGMSQRTLAAKLGLSRTTLRKRMEEYGLE